MLQDDLLRKANLAEKHLNSTEENRNQTKPMLKYQYVEYENSIHFDVKMTEIFAKKKLDRITNDKSLDRPLSREAFNFMFTTLNLFEFSVCKKLSSISNFDLFFFPAIIPWKQIVFFFSLLRTN